MFLLVNASDNGDMAVFIKYQWDRTFWYLKKEPLKIE